VASMPVESDVTCFHSGMMTAPVQDGKIGVRVGLYSYAKTPSVPPGQLPRKRGSGYAPKAADAASPLAGKLRRSR
jgi:hypothetical protein